MTAPCGHQQAFGQTIAIGPKDSANFTRLDHLLVNKLEGIGRTKIKKLFEAGKIHIHYPPYHKLRARPKRIELSKMPPIGSRVLIGQLPPPVCHAQAENIKLTILFEDEHLVVIDKPAGMVVHPAPGHSSGTLVNAILHHCPDLRQGEQSLRPGIVHRLDKGTSGVMVVAKKSLCHEKLVNNFASHKISRTYLAICVGHPYKTEGTIKSTIGRHPVHRQKMHVNVRRGKEAITHYYAKKLGPYSLVRAQLETGRTHQIRVHFSQILKTPILLDPMYANPKKHLDQLPDQLHNLLANYPHPLLHAQSLGFKHPITRQSLLFNAPLPEVFDKTVHLACKL